MSVLFYPCKDNVVLNGLPWEPELWTGRAMLNPYYAQRLKEHPKVLLGELAVVDPPALVLTGSHLEVKYSRVRWKRRKEFPRVVRPRRGRVVVDSQAFQTLTDRLPINGAMSEQLDFARDHFPLQMDHRGDLGYLPPPNWPFLEAVVTYDQLLGVDEVLAQTKSGVKKERGTMATAEVAVEQTVEAGHVYHANRHRLPGGR